MGYFLVRYDSRVVIYERKMFKRLATGLVVMGGDSCIKCCEFNPCIVHSMDIFSQIYFLSNL